MSDKEELPYKYVQALVSLSEFREIEDHMRRNNIKIRREWVKDTLLKEARKDGSKSIPLH